MAESLKSKSGSEPNIVTFIADESFNALVSVSTKSSTLTVIASGPREPAPAVKLICTDFEPAAFKIDADSTTISPGIVDSSVQSPPTTESNVDWSKIFDGVDPSIFIIILCPVDVVTPDKSSVFAISIRSE